MSDKALQWLGSARGDVRVEHRILYVAKFADAVYVLHAFEKRTRRTAKRDVELARQRYRALLRQRHVRGPTGG